jgi:uncharacterized protein YegJ (DUF2314 family)
MTDLSRQDLSIGLLDENPDNPNVMGARAFDLLVDNIQKTGLTEAIVVRPVGDRYRIVSGHHRYKAAQYLGFETVPTVIITDPDFDDEAETFQLVRMNAIKGKLDPQAFIDLYGKVAGKYGDEVLQDLFGFADEAEFKKLITATAKGLPKDLKDKFLEAAKEIKTVDGLAKLLNSLFTKYGDTVPYSYMVFDHGAQKHMWIRIEKKTFDALQLIGDLCIETSRSMDDILGEVIRRIAAGDLSDLMQEIIDKTPQVVLPTGFLLSPTKDNIDMASQM